MIATLEAIKGLLGDARKAASVIMKQAGGSIYVGAIMPFYTPEEWRDLGEQHGTDSVLIVWLDGSDLEQHFSYDHGRYDLSKVMMEALHRAGFRASRGNGRYTAIYRQE